MTADSPLAFFERAHALWQRAADVAGSVVDRTYEIADFHLRLRFAGPALEPMIAPALDHLATLEPPAVDLTVCLWDTESTGVAMPPCPWRPEDSLAMGLVRGFNDRRMFTTVHPASGALSILDRDRSLGVWWVPAATSVPVFERGSPLIHILHCWTRDRGVHCVHAGAVGTSAGGVILAGRGGMGKSTASLACLGSALQFAGDDYCVFRRSGALDVFSIYATAKVDARSLGLLPGLKDAVVNPGFGEEKGLVMLAPGHSESLIKRFPVRALLLPLVVGGGRTAAIPISAADAFKSFAPNCALQFAEPGRGVVQALAALVREVPSYRLEIGADLAAIPDAILGVL